MESSEGIEGSEITLPPGVPESARDLLQQVGYFNLDHLKVGDIPRSIELRSVDGCQIAHIGGGAPKPVLLIFGSYT